MRGKFINDVKKKGGGLIFLPLLRRDIEWLKWKPDQQLMCIYDTGLFIVVHLEHIWLLSQPASLIDIKTCFGIEALMTLTPYLKVNAPDKIQPCLALKHLNTSHIMKI